MNSLRCLTFVLLASSAFGVYTEEDYEIALEGNLKCGVQGVCTVSSIIDNANGITHAECLQMCKDSVNGSCKWYTYITTNRYCMNFGDGCVIDPKCTDCRSGQVECDTTEPTCEVEGCCQGGIVDFIQNIGTTEECLALCKGNDKCEWYSLDENLKICYLLDECSETPGNCIHGQKVCTGTKCYEDSCCSADSSDLITVLPGTDYNTCLDRCMSYAECKFFSFSMTGFCFLLRHCDSSYDVGTGNCFTGQPSCPHQERRVR